MCIFASYTLIKLFCVFNANFAIHNDCVSLSSNWGALGICACPLFLSFYLKNIINCQQSNNIQNFVALLTIYYIGVITYVSYGINVHKTQPSVFSMTLFLQQFCTLLYRYRDRSLKPDKTTLCLKVLCFFHFFNTFPISYYVVDYTILLWFQCH